ncbi:glycoside hydrolase family 130 protein [Alienimonas chondri]|uniref:4-O-beta-D-mannosyl-D-glucose phosphorylase n=1 Tax=Alienimonas chondri TaxID=2681879 RepID=A0ABX1VDW6_9PLAN|nr:glycoside hydrolase family 130 protein [Alienimonas chondri]NNJ26293.1 4-O-beta-D-mannosyl-D-glucose phosphorylase [Alienimonas chondri]
MRRHSANPLIVAADVRPSNPAYRVRGAFNPAATTFEGETLLLLRVAEDVPAEPGRIAVPLVRFENGRGFADVLNVGLNDPGVVPRDTRGVCVNGVEYLSTLSHLRLARSADGARFTVDDEPFLFPASPAERFGVEDARITALPDERGDLTWWINFTVVSGDGWCTALASTKDFQTVTRHGVIFPPANKDVSLFPAPCGVGEAKRWWALHRPNNEGFGKSSIWTATSPDLLSWGDHRCILRPRADVPFEGAKIGGGPPCLLTAAGWVQVYHGKAADGSYALFAALLDRNDPSIVLARGADPILTPDAEYERNGFFPNVVFANGVTHDPPGPDGVLPEEANVRLYYGACDDATCLAETTVGELLAGTAG